MGQAKHVKASKEQTSHSLIIINAANLTQWWNYKDQHTTNIDL